MPLSLSPSFLPSFLPLDRVERHLQPLHRVSHGDVVLLGGVSRENQLLDELFEEASDGLLGVHGLGVDQGGGGGQRKVVQDVAEDLEGRGTYDIMSVCYRIGR